jgi:type II secretory pathway component GspD/PulD (secretin)
LISGHLVAQENDNKPAPKSNLERLFEDNDIQFAPIPPFQQESLRPLTSPSTSGSLKPLQTNTPVVGGPTAIELLSEIKQKNSSVGQADAASARMLVPATSPTRSVQQIPFAESAATSESPAATYDYPTSLASWQEPSQSSRNFGGPLNQPIQTQGPAARVAKAPTMPKPKPRTGVYQLQNVDMAKFESSVVSTWGNRIKTSSSLDGRYVRVEMPTRAPERMAMMIDRETQTLSYEGDQQLRESWHQVVERIDTAPVTKANGTVVHTALIDPVKADLATIQQVVFLIGLSQDITQPEQPQTTIVQDGQDQITLPPGVQLQDTVDSKDIQGVKGSVKILQDPATGLITLVGEKDDIDTVKKYIAQISEKSAANQARVKRIPLVNLQSESIAEQLQEIYDESYEANNGPASIEPISTPNALLVVGQPGALKAVEEMVTEMDVEGGEMEAGGFRAFPLKHMSAADAKSRLLTYFNKLNIADGTQLPSPPVTVVADFRSNTVIVKGAKQFIQEADLFLKSIDVDDSGKKSVVRVFPLRNTLAEQLAVVIQDAISGQQQNAGQGFNPDQQAQQLQTQQAQVDQFSSTLGSGRLSLTTTDANGRVVDKSGIMFDVRVTADRNSNSLVVTGPENSMELVEALIQKLDKIANAETQIKVFEVVNGDAETMLTMLETLFGGGDNQQFGNNQNTSLSQLPLQGGTAVDGATLVNLRFSVDVRTNTIIASGPSSDLQVVEDLLNRLDAKDLTDRRPRVYRLSNAPAIDVAEAINSYLDPRNDIYSDDPRTTGAFIQADRSVIVVHETVSNSLIVSATPEQRVEIEELIRGLDRRPPMVKVKVMIAEVDLDSLEEFGVEVGIQDSLLFDRGTSVAADGTINGIGFPFNSGAAANQNATFQETLAGQALSNLGVGRINNSVGYGGLVLSAGNESVNVLMRALKDKQCVRVLSRPHIMTMENLQGRVQIGASVPRVAGSTQSNFGTTQNIEFVDVGVILEVTPRVSPDGMIVMQVSAVKSAVGPEETGVTIGFGNNGEPIRAQQIFETEAQTTLMARSGQTVVFSGLIQEEKTHIERGAPILSDLPVIGPLFKFESDAASRSELLIIMTPTLITDGQDIEMQNHDEMDRMHWCLSDVAEVYGATGHQGYEGTEQGIRTVYPDSGANLPVHQVIEAPRPSFESSQVKPAYEQGADAGSEVQKAAYNK